MNHAGTSTILRAEFERKKKENPRFSMRALANRLQISVPYLSQILNGKRAIPSAIAAELCEHLGLDSEKRDRVLRSVLRRKGVGERTPLLKNLRVPSQQRNSNWRLQPHSRFWVLSEWYYLALLDATLLERYDGTPEFLSSILGVPLGKVKTAVELLRDQGFLKSDAKGHLGKVDLINDFSCDKSKDEIRKYHQAALKKAGEELTNKQSKEDVERRLITTYTLTVSENDIAWAKQKIVDLAQELMDRLTQASADNVYQFSVQFFPLTDPSRKPDGDSE